MHLYIIISTKRSSLRTIPPDLGWMIFQYSALRHEHGAMVRDNDDNKSRATRGCGENAIKIQDYSFLSESALGTEVTTSTN